MCRNRQTIRVERQLRCLREIGDDRTIVPALYKPVAGEATLGDQNGNEIPLRTSYALTSVEEPPWSLHRTFQALPPRDDATNEMSEEPICLLVLDGQGLRPMNVPRLMMKDDELRRPAYDDEAARGDHAVSGGRMIVEPTYRGWRIEVEAIPSSPESSRYHAQVRLRRLFSQDKPLREVVSCYKMTPDLAEHAALIWAKRWVDANGSHAP